MSKLGKELISSLEWLKKSIQENKPIKQTIVRRMKVKGKEVFTHETFTAPLR